MGKIIGIILLLVVVLFGLSFALLNAQPVELDYYLGMTTMPLSLALVLALIVGALLGVLASLTMWVRQRRELARLRKKWAIPGRS
ncbi:lipopolysaccharide assembly LapA domain-containing protein [Alkalilimnicola ehrlichii]|uniref:LapA family protein n=1 Tax=Alkalilimnicola ehrlichii TaxID=351052 RepID=UPI002162439D|nr:LapA family protein [Alkalilimnicola ehrlichii]